MNAIEILKQDHRDIERLFSEFLAADPAEQEIREEIFRQIETGLTAHTEAEEKAVYPVLRKEVPDKVQQALREHEAVEDLLGQLVDLDFEDEDFEVKFHQLIQDVQNHVEEEEAENGILDIASRKLSSRELVHMGQEIVRVKAQIHGELAA